MSQECKGEGNRLLEDGVLFEDVMPVIACLPNGGETASILQTDTLLNTPIVQIYITKGDDVGCTGWGVTNRSD